ncbi:MULTISPECIES: alanine dehydrogenase [unclassified Halanaerobium]|uniref:alanine dehydrogenase n=1 Tax=unclassified Halanaerobium TaxID=2641197 RepID=UPI000DF124A3|nr:MULTISPECIES: alanine dehydrogenase [unclassified Halanaerobium]RCW46357.1 alanine dehydrogenase [Halanaerobium sp. MA284_MarDTE_T2]RCW82508.1 alanine dehydrogenase [Halanaerobium sp. DL-01]
MIVGVPKEIKNNENRVAITAAGVEALTKAGHEVLIEKYAGKGSGIDDKEYISAGATILSDKKELFERAEMIMKVKEPLPEEYDYFHEDQLLFTYLHLAAEEKLTKALLDKKVVGVAYETIQTEDGSLPLLTPMSEVAGRLAAQEGAKFLEKPNGGRGVLLGGVPSVEPAKVVIVGGGIVGVNAAKMAVGLGADVTIMDIDQEKMRYIDDIFNGRVKTVMSNTYHVMEEVKKADLVIGAVLIPGAKAPSLVTEEMIKEMKEGAVIVDVAIDQGGCVEGTYPTTHDDPVFVRHGVVHYSVANMPGAVARTSTYALTNATLPYALKLANKGYKKAMVDDPALAKGLNTHEGELTYKAVADAFDMDYTPLSDLIADFEA